MNTYYIAGYPVTDELYHHGIKGQRWGIRRYQNPDGSLTPEGIKRYGTPENFIRSLNNDKRVNEGQRLLNQNKTRVGVVGQGIKRQAIIQAATVGASIAAGLALGYSLKKLSTAGIIDNETDAFRFLNTGKTAVATLFAGATAANLYKTSKDVSNMTRARQANVARNTYNNRR